MPDLWVDARDVWLPALAWRMTGLVFLRRRS